MSIFSLFKSKNEKVSLVMDIGNGSITGALVLFKKSDSPEFLYSVEIPFSISDKPNASKLVDDMAVLLNNMLETITKNGFKHKYWLDKKRNITSALITFSSPWFVSKTKHLNLSKENSFVISRSFIDDITKREEDLFKSELGNDNEFEVIEKSIVHTKINGYTLDKSIGKKTKSLDAYLYMSVISKGIINKVESIIQKSFHIAREDMFVHTFPLVSFTVIRDIFSASSDFIIMDITSEVTDLTLVQDDVIKSSASIPSGKNFLIRQISKAFDVSPEIASSTLNLFTESKLNEADNIKMEEVIVNVEKEWSIYLENGLSELSKDMNLPGNVYLTADSDVAHIYVDFLKLSKTDSTSTFRKNLNVNHVDNEKMKEFYKTDGTIKINPFISLLAIFYNKINNS